MVYFSRGLDRKLSLNFKKFSHTQPIFRNKSEVSALLAVLCNALQLTNILYPSKFLGLSLNSELGREQ